MMARRYAVLGILAVCVFALFGCRQEETLVLRVANWEEYIDEGDWDEEIELSDGTTICGEQALIDDFEEWYEETYHQPISVEYTTFGTNEDLYNQLTIGDTYDLICPSEYMAMKLLAEGELQSYSEHFFNADDEENYYARGVSPFIRQMLNEQKQGEACLGDYLAGYMWGTLGFVYNPQIVTAEETAKWDFLRNPNYCKRITAKDSVRDCYFAAAGILQEDEMVKKSFRKKDNYRQELTERLNDTSQETVNRAGEVLRDIRENVYAFETDSGKADLVTGKVAANLQWSGDAVFSMNQAKEDGVTLRYAVPEACTNLWFDGWCMLKKGIQGNEERQRAAEAFVNYLSRPDNAVRNMYYIGYTSVISGGDDMTVYRYVDACYGSDGAEDGVYPLGYFFSGDAEDERYMLRADEETKKGELYAQYPTADVVERSVVMAYFNEEENKRIGKMWVGMRCFHFKP